MRIKFNIDDSQSHRKTERSKHCKIFHLPSVNLCKHSVKSFPIVEHGDVRSRKEVFHRGLGKSVDDNSNGCSRQSSLEQVLVSLVPLQLQLQRNYFQIMTILYLISNTKSYDTIRIRLNTFSSFVLPYNEETQLQLTSSWAAT